MSDKARHRDIATLIARGVIRVKRQPLFAIAIHLNMPHGIENSTDKARYFESRLTMKVEYPERLSKRPKSLRSTLIRE